MTLSNKHLRNKKQRGVALITVLFMFALVTVVISGLAVLSNSNINRSSSYLSSEQAYMLCLSGEELARQLLLDEDIVSSAVDYIHEDWAEAGLKMEIEGGYFELSIQDAQSKFNINNLIGSSGKADPVMKKKFSSMLNLALEDKSLSDKLSGQMVDWLDGDNNGTEEFDYSTEGFPYRPPNMAITSASEIRWLKEMDNESYRLIRQQVYDNIIALPQGTKININTITPVTLAGMGGISIQLAESIVADIQGNKRGYHNAQQALIRLPAIERSIISPYLSIKSDYFEILVRAKYGENYAYMRTLVKRDLDANKGKGSLEVISRDRGKRFIFPFSKDYNLNGTDDENSDFNSGYNQS